MNTATALHGLLESTHLPLVDDVAELVGLPVKIRVQTGPDDYDIIGTSIQSARITMGAQCCLSFLELTFPPQPITGGCGLLRTSSMYTLVSVKCWGNQKDLWFVTVRRRGIARYLFPKKELRGWLRPVKRERKLKAAA